MVITTRGRGKGGLGRYNPDQSMAEDANPSNRNPPAASNSENTNNSQQANQEPDDDISVEDGYESSSSSASSAVVAEGVTNQAEASVDANVEDGHHTNRRVMDEYAIPPANESLPQTYTEAFIKTFPAAWQSCLRDRWIVEGTDNVKFELLEEDEFLEQYNQDSIIKTIMNNKKSMEEALQRNGRENDTMNRYLHLYPNTVIEKIVTYTNQQLAKDGRTPTNAYELRQVVALFWARSRHRAPPELLWVHELSEAAKREKFKLMPRERFNEVFRRIRGCPVSGRDGDDDEVWFEANTMFEQLAEIEKEIYEPSVDTLINKDGGTLVQDDELTASCAHDVEKKTLSSRKTGKKGPVSDCMADSADGKLFGMKLRELGKSEQSNIDKLIERLPKLSHEEHSVRAHFDRGYGKIPTIIALPTKGFSILTMAAVAGSKHPFITQEEVTAKVGEWRRRHLTKKDRDENWINARVAAIRKFILPSVENMGSLVKIAKREISTPDGKKHWLYAIAVHEAFDPKANSKWLRLYSTVDNIDSMKHIFVTKKKEEGVSSHLMFSRSKRVNVKRQRIEDKIKGRCGPLTLTQRVANWFVSKGNRVSGTMAKTIASCTQDFDSDDTKAKLITKCCDSWYARHKSSKAMKQGSLNEVPLAQQLQKLDWVDCFFECGLIEVTENPEVAVSPDGFSLITVKVPRSRIANSNSDVTRTVSKVVEAVVEMKTRLKDDTTILRASNMARRHGHHVQCKYGDDVFKDCVPAENRLQVMHQAFVTGLRWSVFVTSKIVDGEGSIVQTVVIEFPEAKVDEYEQRLLPRVSELVGWLHDPELIDRGYLLDRDFPDWVPEDIRHLLKSRYQLFSALERKIKKRRRSDDGLFEGEVEYVVIAPVHTFKSSFQFSYNTGKWGLDKNTEFALAILPKGVLMEVKYIFRLLAGPLVNLWRVEQADILVPYILEYRVANNGSDPSIRQIRAKCIELTWEKFVYNFSTECLAGLERMGKHSFMTNVLSPVTASAARLLTESTANANGSNRDSSQVAALAPMAQSVAQALADAPIMSILERSSFPPKQRRIKLFDEDDLTRVRLYSSALILHTEVSIGGNGKGCTLCRISASGKRSTTWICGICKIPLCTKNLLNKNVSCFEKWHTCEDLAAAHEEQKAALIAQREDSRSSGRFEQARNVRRRTNREGQGLPNDFNITEDDAMIEEEIERQNAAAGGSYNNMNEEEVAAVDGTTNDSVAPVPRLPPLPGGPPFPGGTNDTLEPIPGGPNDPDPGEDC